MNFSTMQHPIDLTAFAGASSVGSLDDLVGANPAVAGAPMIIETNFLRYYGLRQNPFADCVHPGVFYRTESHAEAFRDMLLAVEFEASLGMITGPSGTGKTLVTQLLLQHLDTEKYRPILVLVTPGMSKTGLLREILSELEVALPVGFSSVQELVKLLSNQIIDLHQQGLRLVIIIDECHFLSADCLHIVRTISNLEVPERKLATCLLFAEERLLNRLAHPSYDSLRNRLYLRARLEPLTLEDAAQYIKFRLMTAGRMTEVFTPEALGVVHEQSGGICRSVNKLCMLSLIEGAARQQTMVGEETVARCAAKM
ncbi:MAG: AAA family ATPase [Chthoniobacteraceae bacterium]